MIQRVSHLVLPLLGQLQKKLAGLTTFQFVGSVLALDFILVATTVYLEIFYHHKFYREGYLMTWLSFAHLALISLVSWMVFKVRVAQDTTLGWPGWKRKLLEPRYIWLIFSGGFLFLALDELLMLHEVLDKAIHFFLQIEETHLTDRLDDVIVLLYAVIGIGVLFRYGRELRQYMTALPFLLAGILATFVMIGMDMITSERIIIDWFAAEPETNKMVFHWVRSVAPERYLAQLQLNETGKFVYNLLALIEEGSKVLAGGFLLASFFQCYRQAVVRVKHVLPAAEKFIRLGQMSRMEPLETDVLA